MMSTPPPPPDPRPGCYDRAWNDPPLFSYHNTEVGSSSTASGSQPQKFNKRVEFPSSTTGVKDHLHSPRKGAGPEPSSSTARPLSAVLPPPPANLPPPPKQPAYRVQDEKDEDALEDSTVD